jgi:amino acid adenylation domain-containing protein
MSTDLEARLAALAPDRIKALVQRVGAASAGPRKMPRNPDQRYPLSSAQERMWFLAQLSPHSKVLNNPGALRARTAAPLDRDLWERSLNAVGRRHEILRTTFHADDGKPVQVIHDELPLRLAWDDLRALPPDRREQEAERIAVAEGRQTFDLTTGPLFAMRVVCLGDLDYLLLITSHHIISDGWTIALFSRELTAAYEDLRTPGSPGLPPQPFQYVDYVHWEQTWTKGEQYKSQIDYWKRRLSAEAPPLRLPADYARPPVMSDAGSLEKRIVPAELTARLKSFAGGERVSLFQLLLTGFFALLCRYGGPGCINIGTSTANRNKREFQNVMGLFVNTLVIRADVSGEETFRGLLRTVQGLCQEALARQDLPFEKLIEELNPQRNLALHPLFQVMFIHQNVPALYQVSEMSVEVQKPDYETAKFDLNLWAEDVNDELLLTLYYARDLFAGATIRRLLGHYQRLLECALERPELPVKDLDCFPREDLFDGEGEPALPADIECFPRRFEAQADAHPARVAVDGLDGSLTYAQANAAANRLARHLRQCGVGAGAPVGLLTARTARMAVGVIAIMKTGAAYVPLDPGHPAARLDAILRDSGAAVVVTEEQFRPLLEGLATPVAAVYLDTDEDAIARNGTENLGIELRPDLPAYIIYTSGTTGTPKGVCVEHRNLASYCDAVWPRMDLGADARFATISSLAADLGNTMIFPPLANGGCVVVVPEHLAADADGLCAFFARHPADCLKIVPTHLQALLKEQPRCELLPRRLLILGGEATTSAFVETIRALAPGCRILNHYGPTETTVGVLTYEVPAAWQPRREALPLGFPLAGSRVYVLDREGRPLPPGIRGEIYIGGANVSRGYWNRPDLTAERFLPDPFVPGGRLYRTGDLGQRLADGAIEFAGRADRQIKIRGFRVELGEIEQALAAHPAIEQAAVMPPAADDPAQRLIGHVQTKGAAPLDAETVTQFLRGRLPGYMVPGAFVFRDALPRTANGKIDFQALTGHVVRPTSLAHRPPRDSIELDMKLIWQDLLGIDGVGISDNFFEVGGHSLLATQLMARINRRFGQSLPLACLFEHGTIQQLAELIRADKSYDHHSPVIAIQPKGTGPGRFFVHPAGGNVLCYYALAQHLGTRSPFYALQAAPASRGNGVIVSIPAMARDYLSAMRQAHGKRPAMLGGWSMGALVAFEMACVHARECGHMPVVAVLDQLAPAGEANGHAREDDDLARMVSFATKVSELVGKDLGLGKAQLSGQSPREQAGTFLERFKANNLAPETTGVDEFRGFLDLMLAHNRITAQFAPAVYPGRIVVFRAETPVGFDEGPPVERAADLGWQRWSAQPVEVVSVPGNHVSMMRAPNVAILAEKLAAHIPIDDA